MLSPLIVSLPAVALPTVRRRQSLLE